VILRGRERLEAIDDVKLRRARALAVKEELEVQRLRSELVPAVYVREWATRFAVLSRDILLKGSSELHEVLAAESDPVKCNQILRAWVERTLVQFCQADELWEKESKGE
jgi:hypothetical protein